MVAHKRLTEPGVTMEWLLAVPRSFSSHPAFLDLKGSKTPKMLIWLLLRRKMDLNKNIS